MVRCVRRAGSTAVGLVLLLLVASCSIVQGPITGPGDINLLTGLTLSNVGYEKSEHFLAGLAFAYKPTAPLTADGAFSVEADSTVPAPGFNTRMVTIRPTDPGRFNGTVIVEWLNVSSGIDLPTDWIFSHTELIRSGAAYVGVSAQQVGVNALKSGVPDRYGNLVHPGDSFSYGIFTEAGRQIRAHPEQVLGGLTPQRLIAAGESQSASRMVTYIDAIHPLVDVYDGFMVHSRSGGAAPLTQAPLASVPLPSPVKIRNDLDEPVMVVQAEGDVISSNLGARQPDTPTFRSWEMAGTSHADAYTVQVGFADEGDGSGATKMFDFMRNPLNVGCTAPVNAGPHHWILNAAYHSLDEWVRTGTPPPIAPLLDVASTSPTVLVRDVHGNAEGGIRTPHVDAPIARLDSVNGPAGFCRLFGSTTPFTPAQLAVLYPTHADFVAAWSSSLSAAVTAGFILPADQPELLAAAESSTVPL